MNFKQDRFRTAVVVSIVVLITTCSCSRSTSGNQTLPAEGTSQSNASAAAYIKSHPELQDKIVVTVVENPNAKLLSLSAEVVATSNELKAQKATGRKSDAETKLIEALDRFKRDFPDTPDLAARHEQIATVGMGCRTDLSNPPCGTWGIDGIAKCMDGDARCAEFHVVAIPKGARVVNVTYEAAEVYTPRLNGAFTIPMPKGYEDWKKCDPNTGTCALPACKWEGMSSGGGTFKNWSDAGLRKARTVVSYIPAPTK